jgi:hypothetical protein
MLNSGAMSHTRHHARVSSSVRPFLPLRGIQRDRPAGMVDVPPTIAAAGGNRRSQRILQGTAFERGIDARMRNGASEIARQDRSIGRAHQRCSSTQRATHASQNAAITAIVTANASMVRRGVDVGRRTSAAGAAGRRRRRSAASGAAGSSSFVQGNRQPDGRDASGGGIGERGARILQPTLHGRRFGARLAKGPHRASIRTAGCGNGTHESGPRAARGGARAPRPGAPRA